MNSAVDPLNAGWPSEAEELAARGVPVLGPGFGRGKWIGCEGEGDQLTLHDPDADLWDELSAMAEGLPVDGGLVGYVGYEAAQALEPSLRLPAAPDGLPVLWARRFERLQAMPPNADRPTLGAIDRPTTVDDPHDQASYVHRVDAVRRAILRGDVFQANVSRPISATFPPDPLLPRLLFARMISAGVAPYAAFLPVEDQTRWVVSNSPEKFLEIDQGRIVAEPIKGTRPRGSSPDEDRRIANALLQDEKDRGENIMIADLMRNDLARVCIDHSIREDAVCELFSLPYVHHLRSRISGQLRPEVNAIDAMATCFPCGSITGAPKVRAMEIIAAVEGEGRGPYCGTVFLVRPDGSAVFSVAIRTGVVTATPDAVNFGMRFGGGITVMSDSAAEFAETVDKSAPFFSAIS